MFAFVLALNSDFAAQSHCERDFDSSARHACPMSESCHLKTNKKTHRFDIHLVSAGKHS